MYLFKDTIQIFRRINICLLVQLFLSFQLVWGESFFMQTTPELGIRDKTPQFYAITNARIIVSPELILDKATLLVENGIIMGVGKDLVIPPEYYTIDLHGLSVYPGFIDAYTSYGLPQPPKPTPQPAPQYAGTRIGGNAWNDSIHAEKDWFTEFKPDKKTALEWIQLGFTVVQSFQMDGIFRGRGFITSLTDQIPNNTLLHPHTFQAMSFRKGSSIQEYPDSQMGAIALIRQTLLDAEWYAKAQRIYQLNQNQKKTEFNAALQALASIKQDGFIFETNDEQAILRAARIAHEFGIPVIHIGSGGEYCALNELKQIKNQIILPLNFPDPPSVDKPSTSIDVSLATLRHWERAPSTFIELSNNNVPCALTTYHLKEKSMLFPALRKLITYGATTNHILAALTILPARFCHIDDQVGTLEEGKLANFFVCDGEFFAEDSTIFSTWILGEKYEFLPIPTVDVRGEYSLKLGEQDMRLILRGKWDKLTGECTKADVKIPLKSISVNGDEIEFALELADSDFKGVTRVSGFIRADSINGVMLLPNGNEQTLKAIRISPASAVFPSSTSEQKSESKLISNLTYPNKAFGYSTPPVQENVLFRNATVWTSEPEGILNNTDVLISNGVITQIGKNIEVLKDTRIIDATGKHLTAGIIDEHSHISSAGGLNESSAAVTAEVKVGDIIDPYDSNMYYALAGGVTCVQTLHGSANPIGGQAQVIKLKWGMNSQELKYQPAPPSIKFALGENVKQSHWGDQFTIRYPQTRMGVETIIRDSFQAAQEYGLEWQKYSALKPRQKELTIPPRKNLQLDALLEVIQNRMFIVCHAYVQSEMLMLNQLTKEFGTKVRSYEHASEAYKIAPELARSNIAVSAHADWWAYKFEVYDAIPQHTGILVDAGVLTSMNSDNPEIGRHLNQEAAKSVMYVGMNQEEAWKMVTINPAKQLMIDAHVGSIKVGKEADLALWNGNPLSIFSTVEQTWIEGRLFFDIERDRLMRKQLKEEKNALIQKVLQETAKKKLGVTDSNSKDQSAPTNPSSFDSERSF